MYQGFQQFLVTAMDAIESADGEPGALQINFVQ
jgi:hypothetical protein